MIKIIQFRMLTYLSVFLSDVLSNVQLKERVNR